MKKSAANYTEKDFDFIIRLVVIRPISTVGAEIDPVSICPETIIPLSRERVCAQTLSFPLILDG